MCHYIYLVQAYYSALQAAALHYGAMDLVNVHNHHNIYKVSLFYTNKL